eukprot:TRINITY_DN95651_c0_g1_i1.p3 TRINITY_DN95651_c0_g1~~TRINITY_DN95651_c0_g1_i1.p3  ORF type:complete len:162 (-),score=9.63 TRINITY_DN95651_c0_g1_i1:264-749(-)
MIHILLHKNKRCLKRVYFYEQLEFNSLQKTTVIQPQVYLLEVKISIKKMQKKFRALGSLIRLKTVHENLQVHISQKAQTQNKQTNTVENSSVSLDRKIQFLTVLQKWRGFFFLFPVYLYPKQCVFCMMYTKLIEIVELYFLYLLAHQEYVQICMIYYTSLK